MTGREIVAELLTSLSGNSHSKEELKLISEDFLSKVFALDFTPQTKKNLISSARKQIKELARDHEALRFLKGNEDFYNQFTRDRDQRHQELLKNKQLLSYPDFLKILESLTEARHAGLRMLGFLLGTGRRVSECTAQNFSLISGDDFSLLFSGQSKTRDPQPFVIPNLVSSSKLLSNLQEVESEKFSMENNKDYQSVKLLSHKIFEDKPHSLRARYVALTLKKEGYLEEGATIDPIIRAKEILGHAWESDATFAYQGFSIITKHIKSSDEILTRIKGVETLNQIKERAGKFDPIENTLSTREVIQLILNDKPFLRESSNLREIRSIIRHEYSQRTGSPVNSDRLNLILYQEGIIHDIRETLRPLEQVVWKQLEPSSFTNKQKTGIIKCFRLWRRLATRKLCTIDEMRASISSDFTRQEFDDLIKFFRNLS